MSRPDGRRASAVERATREQRIVEAVTPVFLRYGYARATMGDLAEAANMSRPALYVVFPNKDTVFGEVIRRMSIDTLADIRAELPSLPTVDERLAYSCKTWGAHGVDLVESYPDAKDLFDLAFPAVREMYAAFELLLTELLRERARASQLRVKPASIAHNLVFAMRGFRETARDGIEMRKMIALEVKMVLAALGQFP